LLLKAIVCAKISKISVMTYSWKPNRLPRIVYPNK
jgi:hypothetical protein